MAELCAVVNPADKIRKQAALQGPLSPLWALADEAEALEAEANDRIARLRETVRLADFRLISTEDLPAELAARDADIAEAADA